MKSVLFALILVLAGKAFGQTNTNGGASAQQWPQDPPVGIGTEGASGGVLTPDVSLQLHHKPSIGTPTKPAVLWLSEGSSTSASTHGVLGLMQAATSTYSSLSSINDLILHEHDHGDLILTNFWPKNPAAAQTGGALRFATAGDTTH